MSGRKAQPPSGCAAGIHCIPSRSNSCLSPSRAWGQSRLSFFSPAPLAPPIRRRSPTSSSSSPTTLVTATSAATGRSRSRRRTSTAWRRRACASPQFYAGCTVCAPSRCTLMTGLHTGHCLIRGNAKDNLRRRGRHRGDDPQGSRLCDRPRRANGGWARRLDRRADEAGVRLLLRLPRSGPRPQLLSQLPDAERGARAAEERGARGRSGSARASRRRRSSTVPTCSQRRRWRSSTATRTGRSSSTSPPRCRTPTTRRARTGMEVPDYGIYKDKDWPEPQKGHAAMISRLDARRRHGSSRG